MLPEALFLSQISIIENSICIFVQFGSVLGCDTSCPLKQYRQVFLVLIKSEYLVDLFVVAGVDAPDGSQVGSVLVGVGGDLTHHHVSARPRLFAGVVRVLQDMRRRLCHAEFTALRFSCWRL